MKERERTESKEETLSCYRDNVIMLLWLCNYGIMNTLSFYHATVIMLSFHLIVKKHINNNIQTSRNLAAYTVLQYVAL
jgi:hypothetical protein